MSARPQPAKRPGPAPRPAISPERRARLLKRLPRMSEIRALHPMDGLVPVVVPLAGTVACTAPLTVTSGTMGPFNGVHVHAGPGDAYATYICGGLKFGGGIAATFTAGRAQIGFSGTQYFCFVQPCSDGSGSTFLTSCAGTIRTLRSGTTIEMVYECRAMCGGTVVCLETGSFTGKLSGLTPDPLHGDYNGTYDWTLQCCPDIKWRGGSLFS